MITRRSISSVSLTTLVFCAVGVHSASAQLFINLGAGATLGVSDNGQVVVGSNFIWTEATGSSHQLSTLNAVSGDGTTYVGGVLEAVRYRNGQTELLPTLPGSNSNGAALAVSDNGSIAAGFSLISGGIEAVRWSNTGAVTSLGFVDVPRSVAQGISSDGTVIVGFSGTHAFSWTEASGMTSLALGKDALSAAASAISVDKQTIVGSETTASGTWATSWTVAGENRLGSLPGAVAHDVSADGRRIVGSSTTIGTEGGAFFWEEGIGMVALKGYLLAQPNAPAELTNWALYSATAITPDGNVIAGYGVDPSGVSAAWLVHLPVVPEANSTGPMMVTLLFLFLWRRKLASRVFQRGRVATIESDQHRGSS